MALLSQVFSFFLSRAACQQVLNVKLQLPDYLNMHLLVIILAFCVFPHFWASYYYVAFRNVLLLNRQNYVYYSCLSASLKTSA